MAKNEQLLIPRMPLLPSKGRDFQLSEMREEEVAKYDVGDTYFVTFSTTSPPAYVSNEYRVTRKDRDGVWGVLIDSSVREMDISEV